MEQYHGIATYTYYFEVPNDWRRDSLHAHIWNSKNTSIATTWPGLEMKYVNGDVYKVEITPEESFYSTFDSIIFNDATSSSDSSAQQTGDLSIGGAKHNNQLYNKCSA